MSEEIKIVAKLDTSDVDNGVKRLETAAPRIKQAVETFSQFEAAGGGWKRMPGSEWGSSDTVRSSLSSGGDDSSGGLVGRLTGRFAIYEVIRGFTEAVQTVASDMRELSGATKENIGIAKSFGDAITSMIAIFTPAGKAFGDLQAALAGNAYQRDQQAIQEERFRQDPTLLKTPLGTLQEQLMRTLQQRAQIDEQFGKQASIAGQTGDVRMLHQVEADRKEALRQNTEQEQWQRKLISIAERRDEQEERRKQKFERSEDHGEAAAERADKARLAAQERAEKAQERAEAAAERKQQAAIKKEMEVNLAEERAGISAQGPEKDLRFTEKLLDHQKATSAVMIHGGLFGRNDSTSQLVSHAAQQVAELRAIRQQLAEIKKDRTELTLL